ncbi:MAG TPA: spore coat U domain-containing protein [Pelomicrobium sp.]|nr:spore coat U domain-containing protein [Pelomicrobium sp.]
MLGAAAPAAAVCQASASGINFGAYDVFSPLAATSTGTITVTCRVAPPPTVVIAIGPSAVSGLINPRRLRGGGSDTVDYNVFIDNARTVIWGDGVLGGSTVSQRFTPNQTIPFTVYGGVPAGQNAAAGAYSDSLQVTIIW